MRLFIATILTLFTAGFTYAQSLTGKVTNSQNEPVVGASVKVTGTNQGVSTNVEGRYTLGLDRSKKYEIEVSAIGYQSKIIGDVEAVNGVFNELNITLEVKAGNMEGVTVTARRTTARMETAASAIQFQKIRIP
ncbi:carboxypeptidase regulatory-like domain-containing protein [Niabella hibiscisoli]|uniref:carboxypeptidase regulatory-like domain-containing protein n=1 Tax=Niabella hibiscisoli TaxID=1825928 RepID=UPI001F0E11D0|nr:carboxypeptidase regulatory-like domain-containing protein [Niabella hibiscisoli]MCH5715686.1 carboxypeptidase-like regulatory domain-containing protein [Niabella hibiscisoli]